MCASHGTTTSYAHTRLLGQTHGYLKTGPATPATKQSHRIQIAIYCSENSNLPATHYRIITTRLTKKSDRRELKSQSQTDWSALAAYRVRRVSIAVRYDSAEVGYKKWGDCDDREIERLRTLRDRKGPRVMIVQD